MNGRNEGWIYFIQPKLGGPVKIGYAGTEEGVKDRLKAIQVGNPLKLHVVGTRPGGRDLEKELHRQLRTHRMSGEWFWPVAEVVAVTGCAPRGQMCPEWERELRSSHYAKGYDDGYREGKYKNSSDAERDTAKQTAQRQGKLLKKMFTALDDGPEKDEIYHEAMRVYGEMAMKRNSAHIPKWLCEWVPSNFRVPA